jgi:WD40 repeat protein
MEAASCLGWVLLLTAAPAAPAAPPTYWQDVRPLLRKHCLACHNARSRSDPEVSGGLALDSYEAAVRAPRKPVILPGRADGSPLVRLVLTDDADKRMPLGRPPLPAPAVDLLRRWIDAGAPEGTRTDAEQPAAAPRRPRRPTEVAIATPLVPPAGLFPGAEPAPLTLYLRVGPLPPATAVAFSPDGNLLACGGHGLVALWDLRLGQVVRGITDFPGTVQAVRFSPDGALLAVAGGRPAVRGDLRLYRAADLRLAGALAGHEDAVAALAFSPDGRRLASAGFDRTVRLWDVETRKCQRVLSSHADAVTALAFGPGGRWLASAGKDCTVRLADAESGKTLLSLATTDELRALAADPDGHWVVAAGAETTLYWWDARTGKRLRVRGGHHAAVNDLGVVAGGQVASAGADQTLRFWNAATGDEKQALVLPSLAYAVAVSPDGKRAAAACFDGRVRLYDVAGGRPVLTLLALAADDGVRWLAQTPQGHLVGSPKLLIDGRWTTGGREVPKDAVWRAVFSPEAVARCARGEPARPPEFRP